jgi:hypothetical protein
MTDEYTNEIRAAYVEYAESADFPTQKHYLEWKEAGGAEAEFDRMIANVKRAAWDEGRAAGFDVARWGGLPLVNPYREG